MTRRIAVLLSSALMVATLAHAQSSRDVTYNPRSVIRIEARLRMTTLVVLPEGEEISTSSAAIRTTGSSQAPTTRVHQAGQGGAVTKSQSRDRQRPRLFVPTGRRRAANRISKSSCRRTGQYDQRRERRTAAGSR